MDVEFLRPFIRLAETENITIAAEEMNISQSAMSAGLSKLEKELGCELFDRSGRRMHLNRNGEYFLEWSRRILKWNDRNTADLIQSRQYEGVLRIGVIIENDTMYFMLTEFQKAYPDIRIELYDEKSIPGDLLMTDMDMFVIPKSMAGDMPYKHLARQTGLFLLVKKGSVFSGRDRVRLEELKDEQFVFTARNNGEIEHVYEICRENGLTPRVTYLCEGPNAKINIILNTSAVGVVYNTMRHFRRSISGLDTISIDLDKSIENHIVLAWRKEPLNPLASVLAEFAEKYERDPKTL